MLPLCISCGEEVAGGEAGFWRTTADDNDRLFAETESQGVKFGAPTGADVAAGVLVSAITSATATHIF